jgi:AAA15 family ATPase/GTPase
MIVEFTVENFSSFKEKQTFSLLATKNKELSETNTFDVSDKMRLLKSAVIYGANASGKSNFFRAFTFFLNFATFSGPRKQVGDAIGTVPFLLSKQTENEPSSFELIFIIKNNDGKNIRYRYGFSVTREEVITEYLFAVSNVREITLFTRERQEIITTDHFREGGRIKSAVRPNSSFLSICAQTNGEIATSIVRYFQSILITSGLQNIVSDTKRKLESSNNNIKKQVCEFLNYADIQIKELRVEHDFINTYEVSIEHSESVTDTIFFAHDYYDGKEKMSRVFFPEQLESSGTQKLFAYAIPVISALENGTPLFIDEFDTQLHPLILENIIKLFNSPDKNKKNAQLVVSCHAVNILTNKNFRRDQIWFCEKDQYGATDLYSLVEYDEPVRNDAAFGKNYLQGRYGAIPYINEITLQIGSKNNGS